MKRLIFLGGMICGLLFQQHSRAINPVRPGPQPLSFAWTDTLRSASLGETRRINIYLPDGYDADSTTKYPVIYLLDGGMQEDFLHISGLLQYSTQPWIRRLAPAILVGIENTNRQKDFTFPVHDLDFVRSMGFKPEQFPYYGGSAHFIRFLREELQPYMAQQFRTNGDRTLIGESLAGLMATEILLQHRQLFNRYIIMSPSLWWGDGALLKTGSAWLQRDKTPATVYIGACNREEHERMYRDALALATLLRQYGSPGINLHYDYLPQETHATIIHEAVNHAFQVLYPQTAKP